MCKVKYASYVREILPQWVKCSKFLPCFIIVIWNKEGAHINRVFSIPSILGIITFTNINFLWETIHYANQTCTLTSQVLSSLASSYRCRSFVPRVRFLRCPRFVAGQIRDVKAGSSRYLEYHPSFPSVWVFSPSFLSSSSSFRRTRAYGINPSQTRSSNCSQAFSSDYGLYPGTTRGQPSTLHAHYRQRNPGAIRHFDTSPQCRTGFIQTPKKTLSIKQRPIDAFQIDPVFRYEALREKVIQQQPVDLRYFLQSGLADWIILPEVDKPPPSSAFPSTKPLFTDSSGANLVPILTAIMFHHQRGGRHDTIPPSFQGHR